MDPRDVARAVEAYASVPRRVEDPRLHRHVDLWGGWAPGCFVAVAVVLGFVAWVITAAVVFFLSLPWWIVLIASAFLTLLVPVAWMLDLRERRNIRAGMTALIRDGRLAIAHVVQANQGLYAAGTEVLPALVVMTGTSDAELAMGQHAAQQIRSLKGAPSPGGEAEPFWRAVNDESSAPCLPLPASLGQGHWAYLVTLSVEQDGLPGNALRHGQPNAIAAIVSADGKHCVQL